MTNSGGQGNAAEFSRWLETFRQEYRQALPAKLVEVGRLAAELDGAAAGSKVVDQLKRELHSLAGSAKTFGIAGVSEAAAAAESFLERSWARGKTLGPAGRRKLTRLLEALRRAAATH